MDLPVPVGDDWDNVEGFSKHEFAPPEADRSMEWDMSSKLIFTMQAIREKAIRIYGRGTKLIVHRNGGFSIQGHSETSLHYKGLAVDFHIIVPRGTLHPLKQAGLIYDITDSRYGLGVYTWGCHLDYREYSDKGPAVWFYDGDDYHFRLHNEFYNVAINAGCHPKFTALQSDDHIF